MPDIVGIIKKAALEAFEASKPVNILFGTVTAVSPLRVRVDQKMILGEKNLILTRSVTDYKTDVTVSVQTTGGDMVSGRTEITVHGALKNGDIVLLVRLQGGKKFAVIDRISSENEGDS